VVAYTELTSLTGNPPAEVKGSFVRITGPFAQSTTFGRYLMFLLIFGVAIYRYLSVRLRVTMAVLLVPSFVFLFLTNTRSAILGVAIGLVVVAVVQRSPRMIAALCLTAILGLLFLPAVGDRFAQLADARAVGGAPTGNTLAWRLGYWAEIVPLANRNPVTGIGPNMTQLQTDEAKKPHNDFLRAYVETGVVGLLAYLAMVVLLVRAGLRALRRAPPGTLWRGVAVGNLGCAVAFVAVSAASNVLSSVATLWYLVAFAAVAGAITPASGTVPAPEMELQQH
jgi:O-antigen ligase